jgi:hypothetical protein
VKGVKREMRNGNGRCCLSNLPSLSPRSDLGPVHFEFTSSSHSVILYPHLALPEFFRSDSFLMPFSFLLSPRFCIPGTLISRF